MPGKTKGISGKVPTLVEKFEPPSRKDQMVFSDDQPTSRRMTIADYKARVTELEDEVIKLKAALEEMPALKRDADKYLAQKAKRRAANQRFKEKKLAEQAAKSAEQPAKKPAPSKKS